MISIKLDPLCAQDLKAALTRFLPAVKSSHRVEALARGFGFLTYASLLAAVRDHYKIEPSSGPFREYLHNHGFEVDPNVFWKAVACAAVGTTMRSEPRLQAYGFGMQRPYEAGRVTYQGELRLSRTKFEEARKEMLSEGFAEAFLRSWLFLKRIPKTKTVRAGAHSYRLKHVAENYPCSYPDGAKLGPAYVPNGALIAAATYAGFQVKRGMDWDGYEHPNAEFNMSVAVLNDLDAECRPNGAIGSKRRELERARHQREFIKTLNRQLRAETKANLRKLLDEGPMFER